MENENNQKPTFQKIWLGPMDEVEDEISLLDCEGPIVWAEENIFEKNGECYVRADLYELMLKQLCELNKFLKKGRDHAQRGIDEIKEKSKSTTDKEIRLMGRLGAFDDIVFTFPFLDESDDEEAPTT